MQPAYNHEKPDRRGESGDVEEHEQVSPDRRGAGVHHCDAVDMTGDDMRQGVHTHVMRMQGEQMRRVRERTRRKDEAEGYARQWPGVARRVTTELGIEDEPTHREVRRDQNRVTDRER